jgi:hypothetical protein
MAFMTRILSLFAVLLLGAAGAAAAPLDNKDGFWSAWSEATFARAEAEKKFVIVSLQSWWCPWCLTMNQADLGRSRRARRAPGPFHPGLRRPGQPARHLAALRALGLAGDHHLRAGRHRDRQAARLLLAEVLHPGAAGDR